MANLNPTAKVDPKSPAKNGFKYQPKYGVIVTCDDETHQQQVYDDLKSQGYTLKVVVV